MIAVFNWVILLNQSRIAAYCSIIEQRWENSRIFTAKVIEHVLKRNRFPRKII